MGISLPVFGESAGALLNDDAARVRAAIGLSAGRKHENRRRAWELLPDAEALRRQAKAIREHAIEHLDHYLNAFIEQCEANGAHVHVAATAEDANDIVTSIAREHRCSSVVKSKSMLTEEIDLYPRLQQAGLDVVETDLGEFIARLDGDTPSHIVGPIMHKTRGEIAEAMRRELGVSCSDDPTELAGIAREHLRDKFFHADMGMTGGNFLIAETGQVVVVENEGNARQSLSTPRVLVSVVGIEKVIPRAVDAAVLLKLLARSGTGQPMTIYTSLFGRPRGQGELDGPEHFHVVLIDNGRSGVLASEYREALQCIRCGACLNACPVYRGAGGGHAYGHVYSGPIGAVIAPLLDGVSRHSALPHASSLCGACLDACPVKIDLPEMLIKLRRDLVDRGHLMSRAKPSVWERLAYRTAAWVMGQSWSYRWMHTLQRWWLRGRSDWVEGAPYPVRLWTAQRDMPAPAAKSFREIWDEHAAKPEQKAKPEHAAKPEQEAKHASE